MKYKSLCLAVLLSIPAVSFAGTLDLDKYLSNHSTVATIKSDTQVQGDLASVLGGDYTAFSQNFDILSAPYNLRIGKAIYIEGRKQNSRDISGMTLYADGRIYAAYYNSRTNTLRYFTNDKSCSNSLHLTMHALKRAHLPNDAKVEYVTSKNNTILRYQSNTPQHCPSQIVTEPKMN